MNISIRNSAVRGRQPLWLVLSIITVATAVGAFIAAKWFGTPDPDLFSAYAVLSLASIFILGATALVVYVIRLALRGEPEPIPLVVGQVKKHLALSNFLDRLAPMFLVFAFLGSFTTLKMLIPVINPFSWDGYFSDLDRSLFFGVDPWRLTHMVIGPMGSRLIDVIYGLWLPVFSAVLFGVSMFAKEPFKRQFLLSFVTIWLVMGLGMAVYLSSAGPCFLTLINHPDAARYADLFPLTNAPGAAFAQTYLADGYVYGSGGIAKGISAMPSIHVAISALYIFAFSQFGLKKVAPFVVFWLVIFVGSIHLGWHYASDGIVGTIGAFLIWKALGVWNADWTAEAPDLKSSPL